jgi:hypothetical protein
MVAEDISSQVMKAASTACTRRGYAPREMRATC